MGQRARGPFAFRLFFLSISASWRRRMGFRSIGLLFSVVNMLWIVWREKKIRAKGKGVWFCLNFRKRAESDQLFVHKLFCLLLLAQK